jgi:hypothetical protein
MRIRDDFTVFPREMASGKVIWYYQTYDEDGHRTVAHSTGETTRTVAVKKCNTLMREGKLLPKAQVWILDANNRAVFFGHKLLKGMNRFSLRTKIKVNIQWLLYCIVHNIGKCMPGILAGSGGYGGRTEAGLREGGKKRVEPVILYWL